MSSGSLSTWDSARTDRIKRLRAAHQALAGTAPGRRWVTEELNQALILRLASEFQGFARDLHDEAGCSSPGAWRLGIRGFKMSCTCPTRSTGS